MILLFHSSTQKENNLTLLLVVFDFTFSRKKNKQISKTDKNKNPTNYIEGNTVNTI
jgi:hypothetical protein